MNPERFIKSRFSEYKISGRNIYVDCPFCSDIRKRLGVHLNSGIWGCFNCNRSGTIYQLALELGKGRGALSTRGVPRDIAIETFEDQEDTKETQDDIREVSPMDGFMPLTEQSVDSVFSGKAVKYLNNRGVSLSWAIEHRLGCSRANGLRVVFPMYAHEKLVYWVARSVFDEMEPKTLHPRGVRRPIFVLTDGYHEILKIGEGVFDAIAVKGVCTLGSNVAENQVERLADMCPREYWICFDGDGPGVKGARKLADSLYKLTGRKNIWIVSMDSDEDPAGISETKLQKHFSERHAFSWIENVMEAI